MNAGEPHRTSFPPPAFRARWCSRALLVACGASAGACEPGPVDAVTFGPSTLTYNLLAHYTFDEGRGTTVFDHSGNKRDGTLTNGTWITDGRFGGALRLSGNDFVTVAAFPDAGPSFTVSAWVRAQVAPQDGFETIVSTEITFQGGWQLNLNKVSGAIRTHGAFWDKVNQAYSSFECPCAVAGAWTHVAAVVDAGAAKLSLYVNGVLEAETPAQHPISPGSAALFIGHWWGKGRLLVGDVDDVAIYGRSLAPAEIAAFERSSPPDP